MKNKSILTIILSFYIILISNAQNIWTQKSSTPTNAVLRTGAFSFTINGKGYVGGGGNAISAPVQDFWEYDPNSDTWSQMANLPNGGMIRSVGFSIGNKGYFGTGNTSISTNGVSNFYEYNPATNTWTAKANFAGGTRASAVGFSIGAKGYLGTGTNNITLFNDFWEYDPNTDIWTQKANFNGTPRAYAVGFSIGTKGYIGTGDDGTSSKEDFWEYDSNTDTWTQKTNFGGGVRRYASGFSISNKGYIGLGNDGTNNKNDFWEYNPMADVWQQKLDFGGGIRASSYGFSIGNKGYMGGGLNHPAHQTDFWEYTPCTLTSSIVSQTNLICNNINNGSATINAINGSGVYTYSWSPNGSSSNTATNLSANIYTCYISDNNSCTTIQTVSITQPAAITSSISSQSNLLCYGDNNGFATITVNGGTGVYSFSWSPTGGTNASISNQNAGTYTCTIKDANLCTKTQTVTITEPTVITSTIFTQTNITCNGNNDGEAIIIAGGGTGALTYSWEPIGGNSATAVGLTAGNYTCVIKDENNCIKSQTVSITQPNPILTSISSQTNVSCFGGSNGAATISVTPSSSLTYTWFPSGGNNATANGLNANNYTCTITDSNGCIKTQTLTISQPNDITIAISSQTNVLCFGGVNGSASLIVNGGTSNYTYTWMPIGGNLSSANNLSSGTYTASVTDNNNCSKSITVNITEPTAILADINVTQPTCIDALDGSARLNITGGITPYSIAWNNGITTQENINISAGNYSVMISDANNCTYTLSVLIQAPDLSCFIIPNGFSPNGDGINDTWEIEGIGYYPNAQVTVLNRWGQEVFKVTNYTTPWNGSFNGNLLPTADYYYIIKLDDSSKPLTGTLTIKR